VGKDNVALALQRASTAVLAGAPAEALKVLDSGIVRRVVASCT
jgi:hypothetical protein